MLHLKLATKEDIPVLLKHAVQLHAKGWPGCFDEAKAHKTIYGIVIGNPAENIAILCLKNEDVVGSIILTTFFPTWSDELFVTEIAFFIDPLQPKAIVYLTDAAEEWGRRIKARGILLGLKLKDRTWHKFNSCETTFVKEL